MSDIKVVRWLDSNCGLLASEVSALPTEPQPLDRLFSSWSVHQTNGPTNTHEAQSPKNCPGRVNPFCFSYSWDTCDHFSKSWQRPPLDNCWTCMAIIAASLNLKERSKIFLIRNDSDCFSHFSNFIDICYVVMSTNGLIASLHQRPDS